MRRRRKRREQLVNDVKENMLGLGRGRTRSHSAESGFGRRYGPVASMNEWLSYCEDIVQNPGFDLGTRERSD